MLDIMHGCCYYPVKVCGPTLLRQGREERPTGCLFTLSWNTVTQQQPDTVPMSHFVSQWECYFRVCVHLLLLSLKLSDFLKAKWWKSWYNDLPPAIIYIYTTAQNSAPAAPSVDWGLKEMQGGRWLSILVPAGQQLTLIAWHYCSGHFEIAFCAFVCVCVLLLFFLVCYTKAFY